LLLPVLPVGIAAATNAAADDANADADGFSTSAAAVAAHRLVLMLHQS
jgi:hypothetical protein